MNEFICWLLFIATQIGIMRGLMELTWPITIGVTVAITLVCLIIRSGHFPNCFCWLDGMFD